MSPTEPAQVQEVRVRPLSTDDLPRVMEIEQLSFSSPWSERTFMGLLPRADSDLLGAERAGRLVGYAVCWTVLDQSELGNVAVAPDARGQGIGRRLVDAAMEQIRRRGSTECFLEVRASNEAAQKVYRESGFEVVGRRVRYYSNPIEDALVMRRDLA